MTAAFNRHLKSESDRQVALAKREGRLSTASACEACGTEAIDGYPRIVLHHHDYAEPLDVIPLCDSCHTRVHRGMIPEPRTGRVYPQQSRLVGQRGDPITLRLPAERLLQVEHRSAARTRSRNEQLVHLIVGALNLDIERLPMPKQGETAADYRERLQRIADGGQ